MPTRRHVLTLIGSTGIVANSGPARAQQVNQAPVRIVAPAPVGGGTDRLARLIGNEYGKRTGTTVLVDNKTGANGNIGGEYVSRAPRDGQTLLLCYNGTVTISPHLFASMTYNPVNDLEPVTRLVTYPLIVVVNPSVGVNSLAELVALARKREVTFGSSGIGSNAHLTGAAFNLKHGTRFVHVPYQGSSPSLTDLLGGRLDFLFEGPQNVEAHIKSGHLRAIGVARDKRLPGYPNVATFDEQGFPGLATQGWYALFAPKNTPRALLGSLHREMASIIQDPRIVSQLESLGLDPSPSASPEEFKEDVRSESARMALLVKASGSKLN